ncbi:tripartite tricarboxylate transporter substrate binding protein [Ramlibacter sp. 2FC]|uniref:Bug family tripartite tricarboxylate transporter substrate binding protein n=1 Tax=Ramlibacter sp. 2FC TaxID=2502188 RepID=UPI0010F494BF|nr:tripartite tricarboxylate transporter substrate binding protein [Ramlibacter sp. 2FC]
MIRNIFRSLPLLAASLLAGSSLAQEAYPSRPITMVVPFGAATGADVVARTVAERMAKSMKATIVVDNKAGASGQIGAEYVARAQPDGYTLLVGTNSTQSSNPFLFRTLRYDPLNGFAPIGRLTMNPQAFLVRGDSPFKTADDLLKFGRANPDKLSYGYGNTTGQVAGAMLVSMGKFKALAVPYKTTPQVFTDLIGGQVDFTFVDLAASRPLIDSGKIRALAITTSKRFGIFPKTPTLRETPGLEDFTLFAYIGLLAPAGTPKPVVTRLNAELRAALETPEVRQKLEQSTGSIVEATTVDEFARFLSEQSAFWKRRISEAGIQPE